MEVVRGQISSQGGQSDLPLKQHEIQANVPFSGIPSIGAGTQLSNAIEHDLPYDSNSVENSRGRGHRAIVSNVDDDYLIQL
jgi:hypothetical protein